MLSILSILKYVLTSMEQGSDRFVIIDDAHILDEQTGVKYHLYDEFFKMTYNEEVVIKSPHFTKEEQAVVWKIRNLITNPDVVKEQMEKYPEVVAANRAKLSHLYEHPEPMPNRSPKVEPDTTEYVG